MITVVIVLIAVYGVSVAMMLAEAVRKVMMVAYEYGGDEVMIGVYRVNAVMMIVYGVSAVMMIVEAVGAVRSLVTPKSLDSLCFAAFCCTRSIPA